MNKNILWIFTYDFPNLLNTLLISSIKKNAVDEGKVFENYYDYSELVSHIKPHRMLALNRAEAMDILSVSIEFDKTEALEYLNRKVIGKTFGGVFDQELKDCALWHF